MEFQITEAIEIVKTLAETENLTHTEALTAFFYEADLSIDEAAELKAYFFESYTLKEMAVDTLTNAMHSVFVSGLSDREELSEVDTKETGEGTKYKVRVKDRNSQSSYTRYATRAKIAELRANPNIASVELTDYGSTGEDDKGERTAAAKGGGDRDGDGTVETSSKEHAGVVHNAIQRKKGGTPDGQDTRMEEFELEEGKKEADLEKMKRKEDKHTKDAVSQKGGSRGDSKNRASKMAGIRGALERKEDPRRDTRGGRFTAEKGPRKPEDHRSNFSYNMKDRPAKEPGVKKESAWEQYLELRENRRAARAAGGYKDDSKKQTDPSKEGFTGISNSIADIMKQNKEIEAKNKKKKVAETFEVTDADEKGNTEAYKRYKAGNKAYTRKKAEAKVAEEWKPDPKEKRERKSAKLYRDEKLEDSKRSRDRDPDKVKDLYKRRMAVDFKKKKSSIGEDFVSEADLVDAGRENQGERDKKKITGKGVDNTSSIKLMPVVDEAVVTEHSSKVVSSLSSSSQVNETLRAKIQEMGRIDEECCPKCGTPECTCEGKKEEKPRKKKAKLDEAGMPILEYSRNNATGPTKEMIDPGKDPEGEPGVMNPKGKPKRYKNKGEAPGDRRPNDPSGPELPFDKGTVPNGSGV